MVQAVRCLLDRKAEHALTLEPLAKLLPPREIADFAEVSPVDNRRRQILAATIMRQPIQQRVGRRVVRLSGMSKDTGKRREQHEMVERSIERLTMQIPIRPILLAATLAAACRGPSQPTSGLPRPLPHEIRREAAATLRRSGEVLRARRPRPKCRTA